MLRLPRNFLGTNGDGKGLKENNTSQQQSTSTSSELYESIGHAVLEFMASIILTYSALYVPDSDSDHLAQYVSGFGVFIVVTTLKDSTYFFPDGTPLVTIMLYIAGLYTDVKGDSKIIDIVMRITGQIIGWAVVFVLLEYSNHEIQGRGLEINDFMNTTVTIEEQMPMDPQPWFHSINEGLGTMIECIAITFATIPLISPYSEDDVKDDGNTQYTTKQIEDNLNNGNFIKSKEEASPPQTDRLILAAISLAAIHYTLERIFHATMNPLVSIIHYRVHNDSPWNFGGALFGQIIGLGLAGLYVKFCRPSQETVKKLMDQGSRQARKEKRSEDMLKALQKNTQLKTD